MTPRLLYIIGVPGSGKTTLARQLVLGRRRRVVKEPFAHTIYECGLVQLGRDRESFGGTDALSMSVQPRVVAALATGLWTRVLAEGDRLANAKFLAAAGQSHSVDVVLVDVPEEVAAERRAARGSNQSETWLKGRRSKVEALRERANIVLDGTRSPEQLAQELALHPVIRPQ